MLKHQCVYLFPFVFKRNECETARPARCFQRIDKTGILLHADEGVCCGCSDFRVQFFRTADF